MGWTVGQQAAIDRRYANVLVSAAAGSGKTAVLTERVFQRVVGNEEESGIDIDRFLIVTFTSAAAQEMKERIADKLSEEIEKVQEEGGEEVEKKLIYLEKQLSLIGKASISTIHAFCLKTVKNYFNHLEIDPNIKVGDESELHLMKLDIIEEILEELFESEDQESFLNLADTYGNVRGMEPLIDLILSMHTFSKSTILPDVWLDEMSEALLKPYGSIGDTIWERSLLKEMMDALYDLELIYNEALKLALDTMGPALYEPVLREDLRQIQEVTSILPKDASETLEEQQSFPEAKALLDKIRTISFGRLPTKKQECDPQIKEKVKAYRDLAKDIIGDLQEKTRILTDVTLSEKTYQAGRLMKELVSLIKLFDERYTQAKREKNVVDYNDLEHMCLKLLITHERDEEGKVVIAYTDVARELSDFYEEIYIDEYQDSNMVQETLLGSIACAKEDGPTRFMVGDMKQSIYRFRLANPLIFAGKYNAFEKYKEGDENDPSTRKNICIDLSQNFRSRELILDATNDLFDQVMRKEVGELLYDEDAKLKVGNLYEQGSVEQYTNDIAQNVELHLVEMGEKEDCPEEEGEDLKAIEVEARMVAQLISELLNGTGSVKVVFDKELGDYRPVEARDIVILLRSVQEKAQLFEEALLERGIDAYADVAGQFFDALEVQIMLAFLHIIDNPRQDIPLITVLRSPIVRLDFDEILQIRKYREESDFYTALVSYIEDGQAPKNLEDFYKLLQNYREQSALLPLEELMNKLFIDTGYYRYVSMLPAGAKKKANLKMLKKYAEDFESNNGVGLFGFLQHMKKLESTGAKVSEAKLVGESENLVRIMTIHKSKGLEFPIVFVCNTDKKFNNQDIMQNVLMHHQLGLGPRFVDEKQNVMYETIPFHAIKSRIVSENISEEIRVLYVALTRAKEKLYLTGTVKELGAQLEKWSQFAIRNEKSILPLGLKKSPTYLNWIGMSLFAHKEFDAFRNQIGADCSYLFEGKGHWAFKLWKKEEIKASEKALVKRIEERQELLEGWDTTKVYSEQKETIYERLVYQYPHQKATEMPVKVAVSALKKKEQEKVSNTKLFQESDKEVPSFMKEQVSMKATTRGTIIHSIFEHLDLLSYTTKDDIQEELIRLVACGKVAEDAKDLVNTEKLVEVAASEVFKRMKKAEHVWKEKAFVYLAPAREVDEDYPEDEEVLIQGVIDTCFVEEDGIVLVDYKTDYVDLEHMEQSIEKIKDRYRIQLDLYGRALSHIMTIPVKEKWLYLYSINKWIKI